MISLKQQKQQESKVLHEKKAGKVLFSAAFAALRSQENESTQVKHE